jgi:hypothetical protein
MKQMKQTKQTKQMNRRYRGFQQMIWVALVALLLLPTGAALASPKDPGQKEPMLAAGSNSPVLLAKRRRYRRYRRKKRAAPRRRKAPPKPAAKPDTDSTPDSDLASHTTTTPAPAVDPGALRRGGRVEFDGRLVQGQTAKSGAIYLFARKRTQLRSMVEERKHYRKEILRTVYPRWKKEKK